MQLTRTKWGGARTGTPSPLQDALSNLSPYLHFGQISAQRVVLEAQRYKRDHAEAIKSFVEEVCGLGLSAFERSFDFGDLLLFDLSHLSTSE